MQKKAFMKTVEILMAIVITTIFLLVIIPKQSTLSRQASEAYLVNLMDDENFRVFVTGNTACFNSTSGQQINAMIARYLPNQYDYIVCSGARVTELPERNVFVDTLLIAGNITSIQPKVVRLYYWAN
ncbi:hypothetical protein JXC34_07290 [Candidatus Woesearchaeota archaeon]|nr:hypothetical protein [Candidatus Woesearchaeota archaeon]